MGVMDKLRGEFIDIIEWTEPAENDVLAYRFPRYQNEIKMGARLIVREGQNAVFVNEGRVATFITPVPTYSIPKTCRFSQLLEAGGMVSVRRSRPRSTSYR